MHVFTTSVDGPVDLDVPLGTPVDVDGVSVRYFPSRHLRRLYWSPPLGAALKARLPDYDLVHLHSVFLWPTWAAARAARRAGRPYVVSPRGMLVRALVARKSWFAKTLWIRLVESNTIRHAAAIHATSALEREQLGRFGFDLPHTEVIPNGVELETGAPSPDSSVSVQADRPYLLFLGRVNWKKGLDRLIPALTLVPDVNLVVAGNDEENYRPVLEVLAAREGVRGRVHFVGPVYGQDKQLLLRGALALVLPSYSENFGNVVLEAMAAGCPAVVTEEVGLADVVRSSGAGVVTGGTPEALGNALQRLAADAEARRAMGEQGRRIVAADYSWDSVASRMEALYGSILVGRPRS